MVHENRLALWRNCLELIRERPLAGHGYVTFEQLFHLKRDERFERVWDSAHNTYLEHAVELGLPALRYLHVPLILDPASGLKLSKQNGAPPIDTDAPLAALRAAWSALGFADFPAQDRDAFLREAAARWARRFP